MFISDLETNCSLGVLVVLQIVMNLTFQQAARGVNKDVNINVTDTCPKCNGTRCEAGTKPIKCEQCNGSGMETVATGKCFRISEFISCFGM